MKSLEQKLERLMFNSRWLLAPFYVGLILGIVILLVLPYNLFLVASIWRHRQASTLSRASAGVWLGATVLV